MNAGKSLIFHGFTAFFYKEILVIAAVVKAFQQVHENGVSFALYKDASAFGQSLFMVVVVHAAAHNAEIGGDIMLAENFYKSAEAVICPGLAIAQVIPRAAV